MDNLLFWLEERHVAGNPKQKDLRRVTAFFCGGNIGLIQKIGGECKKICGMIWKVHIFAIPLRGELKE